MSLACPIRSFVMCHPVGGGWSGSIIVYRNKYKSIEMSPTETRNDQQLSRKVIVSEGEADDDVDGTTTAITTVR